MLPSPHYAERHRGKFVIEHAGTLVVPQRPGKKRKPFDTAQLAKRWAQWNYARGANWRVVQLG